MLPSYYTALGRGRYSFAGNITAPREVIAGGYLTWRGPADGVCWQLFNEDESPDVREIDLSRLQPDVHLRGAVDRDTTMFLAAARKSRRPG